MGCSPRLLSRNSPNGESDRNAVTDQQQKVRLMTRQIVLKIYATVVVDEVECAVSSDEIVDEIRDVISSALDYAIDNGCDSDLRGVTLIATAVSI